MKILGLVFGIFVILGMLLAFIPFLGWLNWVNIPLAVLALIFNVVVSSKSGTILCCVAIFFGILRLMLGFGIF